MLDGLCMTKYIRQLVPIQKPITIEFGFALNRNVTSKVGYWGKRTKSTLGNFSLATEVTTISESFCASKLKGYRWTHRRGHRMGRAINPTARAHSGAETFATNTQV